MLTNQQATVLFRENYYSSAQVVINQGGTSSGKTYAIQLVLFCLACKFEKLVITVAGQDIPNLKAGALRDALLICHSNRRFKEMLITYNKADRIFEFKNGSAKYSCANHQPGKPVSPILKVSPIRIHLKGRTIFQSLACWGEFRRGKHI